jgi:hypothetical protein
MILRLLPFLLIILSVPALAQQATPAAYSQQTSSTAFLQQKVNIDSLVIATESNRYLEHAAFNGKARAGRYRVECFYNTTSKEILKANYLFITDSANFNKIYYFKGNALIKINDNNVASYYQVGDQLFNEHGGTAVPATSKYLMGVIADTWQGIYNALFQ